MITIIKASKETGIPVRTIRQYAVDGKIQAVKEGKNWMISEEAVEELKKIKPRKLR